MKQIFLLAFCLCAAFVKAEDDSYVIRGDRLMKKFSFEQAAELYKTAATRDTNDIVAWEKLGNVYLILDDYQSAEAVYKTLFWHPLGKPIDKFYYGQVLRALGKYDEAQKAYNDFAKAAPNDARAEEFRDFTDKVKPFLEDSKLYTFTPFVQNTPASEIGAAFNGDKMIFLSNRTNGIPITYTDMDGNPYYDMYEMLTNDTSENNIPERVKGKVNRKLNEGPVTFSNDGREMIFTQTNYITKGTDHISKLGLYHADYNEKKGWVNIQPLPFNSYTYNVAHPSLSRDGTKLYLISDMPGGFGETDIYVSERKDSITWTDPVNLGKSINTAGREMFPFIEDNNKLFFSTDSRVGIGGLDIYSAFLSNDNWIYVNNLGVPINTTADDYGYVSDNSGKKGCIVSNRAGGKGSDDIYNFTREDEFVFSLPNVYFDSISYNLRESAKTILDTVANVLKHYPTMVMEIAGHTDSRGDFDFNIYLSQLRSKACEDYLISKGIASSRILALGYGEWKLVNNCRDNVPCTEEEQARNRRVEFKVIKIH